MKTAFFLLDRGVASDGFDQNVWTWSHFGDTVVRIIAVLPQVVCVLSSVVRNPDQSSCLLGRVWLNDSLYGKIQ